MDRSWYLRFFAVVSAVVFAFLSLWPSLPKDVFPEAPEFVQRNFTGRISPGLDIKGGLRLMYEVEVDEYIRDRRDREAERMLRELGVLLGIVDEDELASVSREQLVEVRDRVTVQRVNRLNIRIVFQEQEDLDVFNTEWLDTRFPDLRLVGREDLQVDLQMREARTEELRKTAVEQAVRTVGERIDVLGLREATVIGRETDIIVEVPGADEEQFDTIRQIIQRTAQLEFKVLDDASSFLPENVDQASLPEGLRLATESAPAGENAPSVSSNYLEAIGTDCEELPTGEQEGCVPVRQTLADYIATLEIPDDHELVLKELDRREEPRIEAGEEGWRTYYVYSVTEVTGEDVDDAQVTFDTQRGNQPIVAITFNSTGASEFEELTGANVKRRMAIVLDGRAESAPVIQDRIGGGRATITLGSGDYNEVLDEANQLVVVLRAGALPAPLRPANEQLIGPTLGQDSVAQGAQGAFIGVLLVLIFMAVYYEVAGLVADVMVVLNLLFLLAMMAASEATLTLPGVAAIALTVGMAVDANVLITERIREELRNGKTARAAVDQGFGRAFWSVIDSQLTTFIAGVVLFQYGTGPIKGFAVMLMFGIVSSLFTGIFCSKVMLDWIVRGLRVKRLRVG
ncbi:MAG: protein translocase subunit SecD [Myxococcota bacterium]